MKRNGELWPRLSDVRISLDLIAPASRTRAHLSDRAFRALMHLVSSSAADLVWTYSPPGDGSLNDNDGELARIAHLSRRQWKKVREELEQHFDIRDGRWRLKEEWIAIDDHPVRFAVPVAIQRSILTRDGRVCTYCGDTDGPFDLDHILPVARGGSNDPSNLTVACATCNRSKGALTLREWFAR